MFKKVRFVDVVLFCADSVSVKNMKTKSFVRPEADIKHNIITPNILNLL